MRASVIVPARNAAATLPRALECLTTQRVPFDYEVIVVDDGSSDGTAALAAGAGGRVRLVSQAGEGPAAARNRGVAESAGAVLAFCDADCFPEPGWLEAGARCLERADLVQGRVVPDPEAGDVGPFDRSLWILHEVGLWETANLFVSRDLFDRVGGFEDWLTPVAGKAMAEDVWFGWRAKRMGARSAFCPDALAHHAVFRQGAREYVNERRRRRHFPELAKKMPELRDAFFYRRLFLDRRTAAFDLAAAGVLAALATRRLAPLLAAAPYARELRGHTPRVASVELAADVVSACALVRGSVAARSPVL